jgi:hypothetical protein
LNWFIGKWSEKFKVLRAFTDSLDGPEQDAPEQNGTDA